MAELVERDNEQIARESLSSQYQEPEFEKVMNVIGKVINKIQSSNFEIKDGFWITDAVKNQLTLLGKLWNVARGTITDDEIYRIEVQKATTITQSGTATQIKSTMIGKFGAERADIVPYWDYEVASYILVTDADPTIAELESITQTGVRPYLGKFLMTNSGKNLITNAGNPIIAIKE